MPKLSQAFPSKYLKADVDVPEEGSLVVTITGADFETVGQGDNADQKLVLYFRETEKGLVLNKTNGTTIGGLLQSDDTDDWIGKRIALISADVQYGTEMMRGIRVSKRLPKDTPNPAAKPKIAKPADPQPDDDADDSDIPFHSAADLGPYQGETDNLYPRKRPIG